MVRSISLLFALLALGCADKTGILVEVSSDDLVVPDDIDALRFEATSTGGHTIDETFALEGDWPHSLTIVPADDTDGGVTVTVTGLRAGEFRVRRVVRVSFQRGATPTVEVALTRACLDRMCPAGVDCLNGACTDPNVDGGMIDAGTDGGRQDAGRFDAGRFDAGPDAGTDGGRDDGGMTDAGMDDGGRDGGPDGGPFDAGMGPRLIFSEYVEDADNKALEIVNLGASSVTLTGCVIRRYANGSATGTAINLTGTIASRDVFAVCNGSTDMADTRCDLTNATISHNGDDAYDLACGGVLLDTFGQIGTDPGTMWGTAALSTEQFVLRRRCSVVAGDTIGTNPFDPSVEWEGMPFVSTADLVGIGNRSECP